MIDWPMDVITRSAGDTRALIVKPKKCIDRSYISPDDGKYKISNENKIKIPNGTYFVEHKSQGHFHVYARDAAGYYSMYGRRLGVDGLYIDIYPKLQGRTPLPELPLETAVAVELVFPGHPDSSVPTAIKDCPEELRAEALGLAIYKGTTIIGTNYSYDKARLKLVQMFGFENVVDLEGETVLNPENKKEILEVILSAASRHNLEGYVLKKFAYNGWWKLKGIHEADVFITGFKISTSETYYGQVTAVEVGVYDDEGDVIAMGRVSGFKDADKVAMTEALDSLPRDNPYMYRPIRILYQERASQGLLKHGAFDSWREDKSAKDCLYSEQFEEA